MTITDTGSIGVFGRNITYGIVLLVEFVIAFSAGRLLVKSLMRNKHD